VRNKPSLRLVKNERAEAPVKAETQILEIEEGSYAQLLEGYYNDLKEGKADMPETIELEEFLSELVWLADLDTQDMTMH
jgi:hypothetical protein